MKRVERIKAALRCEEVDRVPVSMWMHFSEVDQDSRMLAESQVAFNEKYDYDFIKMMPFGLYTTQDWGNMIKVYCDKYKEPIVAKPAIQSIKDWEHIIILPATYGTWGKQLQLAQHVSKLVKNETPFIQTIFSPLTTAKKLAGDRLFKDMKENPKIIHEVLQNITDTTKNFVRENINAGVSGFFFATQCASYDFMSEEEYMEFGVKYDSQVLDVYKNKTYFNVVHVHGDNIMFNTIANQEFNCLNWHDRHTKPSLEEAREITNKCFLGGVEEVPYFVDGVLHYNSIMQRSTPEQIKQHVREAVEQVEGKGLIIGPGCVVDPKTSEENLHAVREAVAGITITA